MNGVARALQAVNPWTALAARLYLGGVFLAACFHKIAHPDLFAVDVATYGILPLALVNPMALVLPWIELIAGAMFVVGLRVRAAALLIAGMMVVFIAAIAIALAKGLDLSCGCFASAGAAEDPISWLTLARDGAWLALALYVLFLDRDPIGVDRLIARRRSR